jgi:hypothetical protein
VKSSMLASSIPRGGATAEVRRILRPTDFSEFSLRAQRRAAHARHAYLDFCTLSNPFSNCVTSGVSLDWRPLRPMTRQR